MENEGGSGKGGTKVSRSEKGTPQGGVVSPLLANLYLHWFDVMFHRQGGPAVRFGARLVRYADDFVVLARRAETEMPQPPAFSHPRAAGPNRAARASKRFSQNRKPRRVTELRTHRSTRFLSAFIGVHRRPHCAFFSAACTANLISAADETPISPLRAACYAENSLPSNEKLHFGRPQISALGRDHGAPARARRLPVGPRADLRHHQALHAGRDLRSAGRHRPARLGRARRGTRRLHPAGRLLRADGGGSRSSSASTTRSTPSTRSWSAAIRTSSARNRPKPPAT